MRSRRKGWALLKNKAADKSFRLELMPIEDYQVPDQSFMARMGSDQRQYRRLPCRRRHGGPQLPLRGWTIRHDGSEIAHGSRLQYATGGRRSCARASRNLLRARSRSNGSSKTQTDLTTREGGRARSDRRLLACAIPNANRGTGRSETRH